VRIVAALGGNAMIERGEKPDAEIQQRHVRRAAAVLATLAEQHELVICHGNGPQVGMLALESAADPALTDPYPLDVLVAQTQGMVGYWLAQELRNAGVAKPICALVTQTVVDAGDPAFDHPTKFIGPGYHRHHAHALAARHGWNVAADGMSWRRVVASPEPQGFVEIGVIRTLMNDHMIPICAGGGGAPVAQNDAGQWHGQEAVVDKDLVAAMLARELHVDALLLLTDVPAVMSGFGSDKAQPIREATAGQLRRMHFPAGSMGPKVEACARFVESTHGFAAIGALTDAAALIERTAGTVIVHE
jgi:carbamate kinase